jgi:hypothetical protein
MGKKKQSALTVESDGKRSFISVPAGRSQELHAYLRKNHVRSAPPEPAFTGIDSIQLGDDIDLSGVQALLNAWK